MSDDEKKAYELTIAQRMERSFRGGNFTLTAFKNWLQYVRRGELTREFIKEHYLPVGMSFERCEAEVLIGELKEVLARCDSEDETFIVDSLTGLVISTPAETIEQPVATGHENEIVETELAHMIDGQSITHVSPTFDAAQNSWDRLTRRMREVGPEEFLELDSRNRRIKVKLAGGRAAEAVFTACAPQGEGLLHSDVLVFESQDRWQTPAWATSAYVEAELERIAAPGPNSDGKRWIYRSDGVGRICSMDDGITRTFYPPDSTRAETYGIFSASTEEWTKIKEASTLTVDMIEEAMKWPPPPAYPPLYLSPKAYAEIVKDVRLTFAIPASELGKVVESKPYPFITYYDFKESQRAQLKASIGSVSNVWRTAILESDRKSDDVIDALRHRYFEADDDRFKKQHDEVMAAAEAGAIQVVKDVDRHTHNLNGVPEFASREKWIETAGAALEHDIKITFKVAKNTAQRLPDIDVDRPKTCKDTCTMSDLLSHGHNPSCPEKKK